MKCTNCNHWNSCANRNKYGAEREAYPPNTQLGAKPYCYECLHIWIVIASKRIRQCVNSDCGLIKPLNDDSVQIKHTRG